MVTAVADQQQPNCEQQWHALCGLSQQVNNMKTFEQFHRTNSLGENYATISKHEFQQIQLDAMKEGAIRAALMAPNKEELKRNHGDAEEQRIGVIDFKDRILTAAKNWTEKDLA